MVIEPFSSIRTGPVNVAMMGPGSRLPNGRLQAKDQNLFAEWRSSPLLASEVAMPLANQSHFHASGYVELWELWFVS